MIKTHIYISNNEEPQISKCPQCEGLTFLVCLCVCARTCTGVCLLGIEPSEAEGGLSSQVEELQHLLQDKQKELQQIADHTHTHLEQNLQLRHLQSQVKQVQPTQTYTYTHTLSCDWPTIFHLLCVFVSLRCWVGSLRAKSCCPHACWTLAVCQRPSNCSGSMSASSRQLRLLQTHSRKTFCN